MIVYNEEMASKSEIPNAPEIIHACYAGDAKRVEELLGSGADINSLDERDNLTCLHIACMHNDSPIVDVLLAHNKVHNDLNFGARSRYRPRYAWQYAMSAGHFDLGHKVFVAGQDATRRKPQTPKAP